MDRLELGLCIQSPATPHLKFPNQLQICGVGVTDQSRRTADRSIPWRRIKNITGVAV
jgi:hypothetical protein